MPQKLTETITAVSPLRRRVIDDMNLRNLSLATQRSYLHSVSKFSRYFGCSPDKLGIGGCSCFQSLSGFQEHFVACAEPDCVRAALLLWHNAGAV